jgi:hypothetical protein
MKAVRSIATGVCVAMLCGVAWGHEEGVGTDKGSPKLGRHPVIAQADTPTSPRLELLAHLPLPGPGGDLWAHKDTVYVGSWRGANQGVKLIDIADPTKPKLLGTLPLDPGASAEDMMAISAETPAFKGDLLAVGLQYATRGVEFWDVSAPAQPKRLSLLPTSGGVHELYLLQRGERVLALLATLDRGMQIVDATNPAQPKLLSIWNAQQDLGINLGFGADYPATFDHSVSASADGTRAYVSYWDAGAVILDISDPANPRFLGRTEFVATDEGNLHSAVEADGGRLMITADEDLDPEPAANAVLVTAPAGLAGLHPAIEVDFTKQLSATGAVRGEVVYVGTGLPDTSFLVDPKGKIALMELGTPAQVREQILRAQAAGAIGVLFSRRRYRAGGPDAAITIPGVSLALTSGDEFKKVLASGQKVEVELASTPATWGYLRFWDIRDPAKPVALGTFATPATTMYPLPRQGWFCVHNPFVRGTRLYASWYSDGVRVIDIANPAQPKEIAHFVPPFPSGTPAGLGAFPLVWGAVEHRGLVLLGDMQSGLWILRDAPR